VGVGKAEQRGSKGRKEKEQVSVLRGTFEKSWVVRLEKKRDHEMEKEKKGRRMLSFDEERSRRARVFPKLRSSDPNGELQQLGPIPSKDPQKDEQAPHKRRRGGKPKGLAEGEDSSVSGGALWRTPRVVPPKDTHGPVQTQPCSQNLSEEMGI